MHMYEGSCMCTYLCRLSTYPQKKAVLAQLGRLAMRTRLSSKIHRRVNSCVLACRASALPCWQKGMGSTMLSVRSRKGSWVAVYMSLAACCHAVMHDKHGPTVPNRCLARATSPRDIRNVDGSLGHPSSRIAAFINQFVWPAQFRGATPPKDALTKRALRITLVIRANLLAYLGKDALEEFRKPCESFLRLRSVLDSGAQPKGRGSCLRGLGAHDLPQEARLPAPQAA